MPVHSLTKDLEKASPNIKNGTRLFQYIVPISWQHWDWLHFLSIVAKKRKKEIKKVHWIGQTGWWNPKPPQFSWTKTTTTQNELKPANWIIRRAQLTRLATTFCNACRHLSSAHLAPALVCSASTSRLCFALRRMFSHTDSTTIDWIDKLAHPHLDLTPGSQSLLMATYIRSTPAYRALGSNGIQVNLSTLCIHLETINSTLQPLQATLSTSWTSLMKVSGAQSRAQCNNYS
jgi:hypothetical protein